MSEQNAAEQLPIHPALTKRLRADLISAPWTCHTQGHCAVIRPGTVEITIQDKHASDLLEQALAATPAMTVRRADLLASLPEVCEACGDSRFIACPTCGGTRKETVHCGHGDCRDKHTCCCGDCNDGTVSCWSCGLQQGMLFADCIAAFDRQLVAIVVRTMRAETLEIAWAVRPNAWLNGKPRLGHVLILRSPDEVGLVMELAAVSTADLPRFTGRPEIASPATAPTSDTERSSDTEVGG